MDRAMAMPPPTPAPPMPRNLKNLSPEEQAALLAQGYQVMDDGSLVPPSDPGMNFDYSPGGFGRALSTGAALPLQAPTPAPSPDATAAVRPTALTPENPAFSRFFATRDAGFPGTPGGVGGGPVASSNPMGDALPAPEEAPAVRAPLQPPPSAAPPEIQQASTQKQGYQYPGKIGRRMSARAGKFMGASGRRR